VVEWTLREQVPGVVGFTFGGITFVDPPPEPPQERASAVIPTHTPATANAAPLNERRNKRAAGHRPALQKPLTYRLEDKMQLSKDRQSLKVNETLTLSGIPPEAFEYRLGSRSALEWVIDQYQVTEDKHSGIRSDPNCADDPEYIVRLVGQVVRVSLETARIVKSLPSLEAS
jgi:Type ISP C-terminal specificity domain